MNKNAVAAEVSVKKMVREMGDKVIDAKNVDMSFKTSVGKYKKIAYGCTIVMSAIPIELLRKEKNEA